MNIRSAFVLASCSAALVTIGCSRSSADNAEVTVPVFGATTAANSATGTVSALSGSCPVLTFTFEKRTIKADAATVFGDGGCSAIRNGAREEIVGTAQADGSTKATRINAIAATPPTTPPTPVPVPAPVQSVTGGVKSLAGTCPTLSFALESKNIRTNVNTVFGAGGCGALKNDVRVVVSGSAQTDGSILALGVTVVVVPPVTPPPTVPTPVTPPTITAISGAITALTGTCPQLLITVGERKATTSAGTLFDGKTCAALTVGAYVDIAGPATTASVVLPATKVTARK